MAFPFGSHVEPARALQTLCIVVYVYFQLGVEILDLWLWQARSDPAPRASVANGQLLPPRVGTYWNDEVKEVSKRAGMAETGWSELRFGKR